MLSIVICSRDKVLAGNISDNIEATIGIPYELLILDNAVSKTPIARQYNAGAQLAKYDHLLFIHEDIKILTDQWGKMLVDLLQDKSIGLVGITGGKYYPDCPGTWPNDEGLIRENIFYGETQILRNPDNEIVSEVATVDGVFLACRKEVWEQYRFDDGLKSFHFYDLDLCFRIITASKLKLVITYNIDIVHFSGGTLNKDWIEQSILFYKKWHKSLPLSTATITQTQERFILKKKVNELIYLYYFKNDGKNKAWLANFYMRYVSVLGLSKSLIFTLRYILFGASSSFFNKKISKLIKSE